MSQSENIDLILVGKSGNGSSATGNYILGRNVFQENASGSPTVNREPVVHSSVIKNKILRVVDCLDLGVTDKSIFDRQLDKAMSLVNNSFSALLIIVRSDVPFSKEEVTGLKILKECLGQNIIRDFGICVVTHGDHFQVVEAEKEVDSFEDCYTAQGGDLLRCFAECRFRCVLFNNKTESEDSREQQVRKLCRFATELSEYHFKICGKKKFENNRKMADKETKIYQESKESSIRSFSLEEEGEELLRETELRLTEIEKERNIEIKKLLKEIQSFTRKLPLGASDVSYQKISEKFTNVVHDLQSKLQATSGRTNQTVETEVQRAGPDNVDQTLSDTSSQNRSALVADDPAIPGWIKLSEPKDIHLLLLGKTGSGLSATGNSVLGRRVFRTSSSPFSETREAEVGVCVFNGQIIRVVDGPPTNDTRCHHVDAIHRFVENMEHAFAVNSRGYDAFLLVHKLELRITKEDEDVFMSYKKVFGEDFLKTFGILVVTWGDEFDLYCEEEGINCTFKEYCDNKKGSFKEILNECNKRAVLFDNKTKDENTRIAQTADLIKLVNSVRAQGCTYTDSDFAKAKEGREKMMEKTRRQRMF